MTDEWFNLSFWSFNYTESLTPAFFQVWQKSAWIKSAALKLLVTKKECVKEFLHLSLLKLDIWAVYCPQVKTAPLKSDPRTWRTKNQHIFFWNFNEIEQYFKDLVGENTAYFLDIIILNRPLWQGNGSFSAQFYSKMVPPQSYYGLWPTWVFRSVTPAEKMKIRASEPRQAYRRTGVGT